MKLSHPFKINTGPLNDPYRVIQTQLTKAIGIAVKGTFAEEPQCSSH